MIIDFSNSLKLILLKLNYLLKAREIALWLSVLAALVENSGLFPKSDMVAHNHL